MLLPPTAEFPSLSVSPLLHLPCPLDSTRAAWLRAREWTSVPAVQRVHEPGGKNDGRVRGECSAGFTRSPPTPLTTHTSPQSPFPLSRTLRNQISLLWRHPLVLTSLTPDSFPFRVPGRNKQHEILTHYLELDRLRYTSISCTIFALNIHISSYNRPTSLSSR